MVYRSDRHQKTVLFEALLIKVVVDHGELYARRIAEFMYPFTDIHCCTVEYARVENALRRLTKQGRLESEMRKDISNNRSGYIKRRWYRAVKESASA